MTNFKPLVFISNRKLSFDSEIYSRRLRISGYTAIILDEKFRTNFYSERFKKFLPISKPILKSVCEFLEIEYKDVNTYLFVDIDTLSFATRTK